MPRGYDVAFEAGVVKGVHSILVAPLAHFDKQARNYMSRKTERN